MIVWIASYPRSGNRLCRTVLRHAFRAGPMGFPARKDLMQKNLGGLLDELGVGPDDNPLPALRACDTAVFLKTHSLPHLLDRVPGIAENGNAGPGSEAVDESPAFYVVRDGRDSIVSFAHYLQDVRDARKFRGMSFEEVVATLIRQDLPYGGWSGNVNAWRRRAAPTAMVRFDELIRDPIGILEFAARSLGVRLRRPRGMLSFDVFRAGSVKPSIMRKGRRGSWRSEFPPELLDEFWERHGAEMAVFGYSRD